MEMAARRFGEAGYRNRRGPGLLRFLTCGSVDDGKSTLIGRLLYDLEQVPTDQLASLQRDAQAAGREVDLAFLLDGLEAEQEQGITIDVAYRYFRSPKRSFIVADAPGHEQYTRNMATGASVSDLAILLVDARKGVLTQTRRHSLIVSHFGTRNIVLAVNKLDLVGYSQDIFSKIENEFREFARNLGFRSIVAIPVSALKGDNLVHRSKDTAWYQGPTLIELLDSADTESERQELALRLPVQWVCRPDLDFRGLAGTIRSGTLRLGDPVMVAGAEKSANVARILRGMDDVQSAGTGDAVMVTLREEIDASRGDVLCHPQSAPTVADQVAAHLLWLSDSPMIPGRSYLLKCGSRKVPAEITALKHRIDVNSGAHIAARALGPNEIGLVQSCLHHSHCDRRVLGQSRHRLVHSDRPDDECDHRRRHDQLRTAARVEHSSAETRSRPRPRARRSSKHKPAVLWFTGPFGRGQIHDRKPCRAQAERAWCAYLFARRR